MKPWCAILIIFISLFSSTYIEGWAPISLITDAAICLCRVHSEETSNVFKRDDIILKRNAHRALNRSKMVTHFAV